MSTDLQKAREDLMDAPSGVRTDIISVLKVVHNQCVSQPELSDALSEKHTKESIDKGVEDLKANGFITSDGCGTGYVLHLSHDYQSRAKEYIRNRLRNAV
ncbi:MAG: hypothetical protein ABJO02_16450 [Reichenbachiella sp.]|uniref:hypothetical protein n=1 Tax=Reichenbachiella sp. TaxID=2184521 RepID=UPI003298D407